MVPDPMSGPIQSAPEFQRALRTLVRKAQTGGVEVYGGWELQFEEVDLAYDVEIVPLDTRY